jgi:gamma-butyrobetaine dioxygenase
MGGGLSMNQIRPKRIDTMLDLASYPIKHRIERVALVNNQAIVDWSDGRQSRFHALWLRDNCACPT